MRSLLPRRLPLLSLLFLVPHVGFAEEAAVEAAESSTRMHLSFSVFGQSVPSLDLAAQAGASGFGDGDDATALSLGVEIDFGVELNPIELGVSFAQATGGLDQDDIEERYFDGSDTAQGASTTEVGLHAWWVGSATTDLQLLSGPHVRWLRMKSTSGVADAQSDSLGLGGQFGIRYRTHKVSPTLDGAVRAMISLDANLPLEATVRGANGDALFTSDSPDGAFFSYTVSAGFCLSFK